MISGTAAVTDMTGTVISTERLDLGPDLVDRLHLGGTAGISGRATVYTCGLRKENTMAHGPVSETRVLLDGFGMGESPRWHEGRLWFSNWGANEIVAVDLEGNSEVIGAGGGGSGWAVNWLRDGRMLVTGSELLRVEHDASRVRHADLRHVSPYGWSEITVDGPVTPTSTRSTSTSPTSRRFSPAARLRARSPS
jgi:hypothetical protein